MSIRYARQEALWGEEGQRKLSDAHVAVIGAGGLGSPALLYLAGAGVGRISLFDDDVVSPSNLHRQVIHTTAAIGTPKTDSAAAAVRALNPEVDITCHGRLESATALKQLRGCDLILDGTDNFDARYLSSFLMPPWIWMTPASRRATPPRFPVRAPSSLRKKSWAPSWCSRSARIMTGRPRPARTTKVRPILRASISCLRPKTPCAWARL